MLTSDDLRSFTGKTITRAETRVRDGRQVLRLHLEGGEVLAVEALYDDLNVADESAEPLAARS